MKDCVFCKIAKGEIKSWKIYEDEYVLAFFDINPVSEYHTLVIPKKHFHNIFDISEDELLKVMSVVKKTTALFNNKLGIKNIQIISSSGKEAQQDIFHIHFHIVPRKQGDNQDIKWIIHKDLQLKFDELLTKIF